MGRYTVDGTHDGLISLYLDSIVDFLVGCFSDVISILLVGGFARGEGVISLTDHSPSILSDFDLYVILREGDTDIETLAQVVKEKVSEINAPLVNGQSMPIELDLHFIRYDKLPSLPVRLRFFDLQHGSSVLHGADITSLMPEFKPEHLAPYEGFRLLLNRLYYTSAWFDMSAMGIGYQVSNQMAWKFQREAIKNHMMCCYALLLIAGRYDSSALRSAEMLRRKHESSVTDLPQNLAEALPRICDSVSRGLSGVSSDTPPINLWYRSLRDLIDVVEFYQGKAVGMKGWDEFCRKASNRYFQPYVDDAIRRKLNLHLPTFALSALSMLAQASRRFRWLGTIHAEFGRTYWKAARGYGDPAIFVYGALFFLFKGLGEDGFIHMPDIKEARACLECVYPVSQTESLDTPRGFNAFMAECVRAYNLYFGKGPEVKNEFLRVILRVLD